MKYFIITFGCQMNKSDSEKIATVLQKQGHKPVGNSSPAEALTKADLIVINACSVRQSALNRVFGQIQNYPGKKIAVAGCLTDFDKKRLAKYKNVAIWHPDDYFHLPPLRFNKASAFVPIMTGCNNFCSYCVVPYTRGREKSRPTEKILKEVRALIKKGYEEIILLGQNVNSYKSRSANFTTLLKMISDLPDDFWLSFLTSHPKDMSDELITTAARCKKVSPYIHLPVQSGDDRILCAMNRHYTATHYKKLIKKLRAAFKKHRPAFPPLAISTDIIVGFPGETKKQFMRTAELAREISFDMIYFAQYSPRPGTAAARLTDDVPPQEKKRRAQFLNDLLKKMAWQNNKKYINKTTAVLIEETKNGFAFGKTATGKSIKLTNENYRAGDMIRAKIIDATAWGLRAKRILEKPRHK